MECPDCGMLNEPFVSLCLKCDAFLYGVQKDQVLQTDIAHAGEDVDTALEKLHASIDFALRSNLNGIKVIHGAGKQAGHSAPIKRQTIAFFKQYARSNGGELVADGDNVGTHYFYF